MTPADLMGGLDMLEIVAGIVFGLDHDVEEPPPSRDTPLEAWERHLLPFLQIPPCGVTFSGGRDSSAVLAVASAVARKHGLADPVPITLRYPGNEAADETSYQELVIRHLGLDEWVLLEPGGSLDILGDIATKLTEQHGVLFPGNIQSMVPMLEVVPGGSLLSGLGGDEVMAAHPNRALAEMVLGRTRPTRGLLKSAAKRWAWKSRLREPVRRAVSGHFTWLLPEIREQAVERLVDDATSDALFAHRNLTKVTHRTRYLRRAADDIGRVAAGLGVAAGHPFLAPGFIGAVADRAGRVGFVSRADAMRDAFGGVLPPEIIQRTTKAQFNGVFWTKLAEERVEALPVDRLSDLVDEGALRRFWRSDAPKGNTYLIAKLLRQLSRIEG